MDRKQNENRCQGRTKNGRPCRAFATEGGLCFLHSNPNKAAELGRKGGRKNRHAPLPCADPLPPLTTATNVRDTVAGLIEDVRSSRVPQKTASVLTPMLNLLLKAIETSDLERRIEALEKREAKSQTSER